MTERQKNGKAGILTGAVLKNIAYVTMFVDHFFAVVFLNYMNQHSVSGRWDSRFESIYRAGRAVGRIAFHFFNCGGLFLYEEQGAVPAAALSVCAALGDSV